MKDLVGIGKTVKTVSDAVRGAVSTLYRPTAIRKEGRARADVAAYRIEATARAEAKAALIRSEGAAELAERARERFLFEQMTQQQSLECIFEKAIEYSKQKNQKGKKISEDWLYRLIMNAKDVTNEEIQEIFAKLIVEQGSAARGTVSFMTLDALRLFEPRHARYFESFCQLYYLFGGAYFGIPDRITGQWTGDEQFNELDELGIIHFQPIDDRRIVFRDFSMEITPVDAESGGFRSIFGEKGRLSLRGVELSKVLYPEVSNQYWHRVRRSLSRRAYERALAKFVSPDIQYLWLTEMLRLVSEEEGCQLVISVYPWVRSGQRKVLAEFDDKWRARATPGMYVPPYLRRFVRELPRIS